MKSLAKSYDPQQGPAFGQLSREDISKVVKKEDVDLVIWSIGKRPKGALTMAANVLLMFFCDICAPQITSAGFPAKKQAFAPAHAIPNGHSQHQDGAVNSTLGLSVSTGDTFLPAVDGAEVATEGVKVQDEISIPTAPAAPLKPKSWAELVRPKHPTPSLTPSTPNGTSGEKSNDTNNKASGANGVKFDGIADVLHNFKPTYSSLLIQPRGLVNNGNMCFMNAILQPLLHCPPFYNLLMQIGKHVVHKFKSTTPLVDSLIMFLNEFHVAKKNQPDYGTPFVPEYVYDALRGLKRFDSMRGRQEDCQEFLGFLLDGLHEEFYAAMKEKPMGLDINGNMEHEDSESGVSEDEWMEDSVTLEPFQSMQLDLTPENVHTIEDALRNSTIPEVLDGFTSSEKGGIAVEATKKIFIEHVPPVLVLHLKRFIYKDGRTQKLHKEVGYKTVLNLQPDIISPTRRPSNAIPYKLFGVVYHHGRTAAGGHYTCDVLRQNDEWLHIDDTNITVISEADVTLDYEGSDESHSPKPVANDTLTNGGVSESTALAAAISASSIPASRSSDGVAYVLFYIRSDQKNSAPTSGSTTPTPGASTPKSMTNGTHAKPPGAAWSVSKK
ncbi:hypothetical protein BGZ54_008889 [Gamsiella multidivaricata]|nr:hypothetical protein BGZ54_008889 [Gamsiella multidivaricata]